MTHEFDFFNDIFDFKYNGNKKTIKEIDSTLRFILTAKKKMETRFFHILA